MFFETFFSLFLRQFFFFFFLNYPATTEIYTLSLHDALPITSAPARAAGIAVFPVPQATSRARAPGLMRSEEHTSELQSQSNLVCRLLLEKKKTKKHHNFTIKKNNKK